MRKHIFIILISIIPLTIVSQNRKAVWDYPIKPGTEKWKQLDTESLVQICYDFPAFTVLLFYNSPQAGFDVLYSNFNGLRELLNRKDVGHFLLKKYTSMSSSDFNPLWKSEEKGLYTFKYAYFETILAQPQVIQSFNLEDRKLLLKETIKKFDEKVAQADVFGGNTFAVNAWVMAKNLNCEKKLTTKFSVQSDVEKSLKSGSLFDYDLEDIYQQTKKYIHE
jgi:hypothetical protein